MLNVNRESVVRGSELIPIHDASHHGLKLADVAGALKRGWLVASLIVGVSLGIGIIVIATSATLYTATTEILIDGRRSNGGDGGSSNRSLAELGMDPASIDSQVAVLGSEKNTIDTIRSLHLERDPDYATPTSLFGQLWQALRVALGRRSSLSTADGVSVELLESVMKRLDVKRIPQTYVLTLSFSARNPERAAAVANTMVNNYINWQIQSVVDARRLSRDWFKTLAATLRSEIAALEQVMRSAKLESQPAAGSADWSGVLPPRGYDRNRPLERDLVEKRAQYTALIERSDAMLQNQSLPVSNASVLKSARAPERRSHPNVPLIILLSLGAGLAAACGKAVWSESGDRSFRLPSQISRELGLPLLGSLKRRRHGRKDQPERDALPILATIASADRMRNARLRALGVTAAMPQDDSSLLARSLAAAAAVSGFRTLLIGRGGELAGQKIEATTFVDAQPTSGCGHPVHDEDLGVDVVTPDRLSNLDKAAFARGDVEAIQQSVGHAYDLVVIDLPPLCMLANRMCAGTAGGVVLAVAWGKTQRGTVIEAVRAAPVLADRLVGAVFTGVQPRDIARYAREPADRLYLASTHDASV